MARVVVRTKLARQLVSFQRAIVPLLRMLANPLVSESCLASSVNPIYATLSTPAMWTHLERCMAQLMEASTGFGDDAPAEDDQVWEARSWSDTWGSVAAFARKAVGLDRSLVFQESFRILSGRLQQGIDVHDPTGEARELRDNVRIIVATVRATVDMEARRRDRESAAVAKHARDRLFPRGLKPAASVVDVDGPGEASRSGPRHDNDFEDFREICIGPTAQELLCQREPYLPANTTDFPHHVEDRVQRLLDTQFRLLRHDLLAPLIAGANDFITRDQVPLGAAGGRVNVENRNAAHFFAFRNLRVIALDSVSAKTEKGTQVGLYYLIEFDQPVRARSMKDLEDHWQSSRRLQKDTLVCVWLRGSPNFVFATVAERGSARAPVQLLTHSDTRARIGVSPCGPAFNDILLRLSSQQERAEQHEALLLQASDSFFAYEPVLRSLQLMDVLSMPFQGYLLPPVAGESRQQMKMPKYIWATTLFDLSLLASAGANEALQRVAIVTQAFPTAIIQQCSTLDDRQIDAIRIALTSEVSLIQGPPGKSLACPLVDY